MLKVTVLLVFLLLSHLLLEQDVLGVPVVLGSFAVGPQVGEALQFAVTGLAEEKALLRRRLVLLPERRGDAGLLEVEEILLRFEVGWVVGTPFDDDNLAAGDELLEDDDVIHLDDEVSFFAKVCKCTVICFRDLFPETK